MNVLFRFRCSCCGKELLTDSVLLKCCEQLMDNVEHVVISHQQLRELMSGLQGSVPINIGRG